MDNVVEYKCTKCKLTFYRKVQDLVLPKKVVPCINCNSKSKIVSAPVK